MEINEINQAKHYDKPCLGYIIVGDKPESKLYVKLKTLSCDKVGIEHQGIILKEDSTEQEVVNNVIKLSQDPKISGILV